MMRCLLVLLLACSLPGPAAAQAMPAGVELPLDVRLAVRVLNINRIQEVQREVSAAVEFTQRWTDPALRFDRIAAGTERLDLVAAEAERRLAAIWQPGIAIENMIGHPRGHPLVALPAPVVGRARALLALRWMGGAYRRLGNRGSLSFPLGPRLRA